MPTRLIVTDPEPPTWWALNKAAFCTVVGLLVGMWIGAGCDSVLGIHPDPGTSATPVVSRSSIPGSPPTGRSTTARP